VPVYIPALTGTHYTYTRKDGQAELSKVDGYIPCQQSPMQLATGLNAVLINFIDATNDITNKAKPPSPMTILNS